MIFVDRHDELARLNRLVGRSEGGLAIVYGRRRVGKTRLMLEWATAHDGLYTVADQSAPQVQRRYLAQAIAQKLPGFADVEYPEWGALLDRLAREAATARWRGPFIIDELPYLVLGSGELPSVLQRWVDHDARQSKLVVALAGSSQRMMQGLVLSADAPLFGRATELIDLQPISPRFVGQAFGTTDETAIVEAYAAWGGVPRYWELAVDEPGDTRQGVQSLVLDPLGPLHREPDRLLIEEIPSALEVRPVLDAIGAGAHRVSEVAGRIGRPATSLSRPLRRLVGMGLVRREVPFGENERKSKRSLYRIDDPFFRLWFRVVAPHRALLATALPTSRLALLDRYWEGLVATAWEELCRLLLPTASGTEGLATLGPWGPAARWWRGNMPEWDIVAESVDGKQLLLGEAKWSRRPLTVGALERLAVKLNRRHAPVLSTRFQSLETIRALFVPNIGDAVPRTVRGVQVVTGDDLLAQAARGPALTELTF